MIILINHVIILINHVIILINHVIILIYHVTILIIFYESDDELADPPKMSSSVTPTIESLLLEGTE